MLDNACKSVCLLALIAAGSAPQPAHAALDILYVNRCVGGCSLQGGTDDAVNRISSLLSGNATITEFPHGNAVFDATVSCVRSVLAQYDVNVVTTDPGTVRREVILAGHASEAGMAGVWGNAPWQQGIPIDNAIGFAFATDIGASVDNLCWTAAQQFGTLYGLDHEFYCSDLMAYSVGCGVKTFTNFDAPCGTFTASATCDIPGTPTTQNSSARLATIPGQNEVIFRGLFELLGPAP